MPSINMGSIMAKLGAYSRSVDGKLRMKGCLEQYRAEGKGKTNGGGKLITEDDMYQAAYKMMDILRMRASECELPASVMKHFDTMDCGKPFKLSDGSTCILIFLGGDLSRESLEDGEGGHTGDGIDNIVALFNNGAHASDYVYGWWNGHSPTGEALSRSGPGDDFAWVRSRKDRPALGFIQSAVHDFNGNYGADYNVTAEVGDAYKK